LTASVFFSFRDASPYLQCYSVSHLMQSGILTEHEGRCLERIIEVNAPQSITAGPCEGFLQHDCADVADGKLSPTNSAPQTRSCNSNAKARDCLLWWINMRVRAAVNEGLLDKKTMKKALAGIWNVRDSFELLTVEASRRPMQLWSVLMQIMVDAYVVLVPISTLQEVYHNHVWLLPWAVLRSFVVAFFYDALLHIVALLWEPFGTHADRLDLDAVVVTIERSTFVNFGRLESSDLSESLRQTWQDSQEMAGSKDKSNKIGKASKAAKVGDNENV